MTLMKSVGTVTLDIALDNPKGIYKPGETVTGYVSLIADKDIPVAGVYLWILGQAEVEWPDRKAGHGAMYTDYEIYMKECIVLWNQEQNQLSETGTLSRRESSTGTEKLGLNAGEHRFDFRYGLADSLPSSFRTQGLLEDDGTQGHVYYLLRVKLDSVDAQLRRQHKDLTIIVLRSLDLNHIHKDMFRAVALHSENVQCSWCYCSSGSLSCSVRLDRTGFVPGEDISVDVQVENLSHKDVSYSTVSMKQVVVLHTSCSSHKALCDIFSLTGGKVKAGDNGFYHDIIHIPPLPPSGLEGCSIIDVEYIIETAVYMSGSDNVALEMSVPITVGTIPLQNSSVPGLYVSSNFQRYSHSSGSIEGYTADSLKDGRCDNVYLYYKCQYKAAASPSSAPQVSKRPDPSNHRNHTSTALVKQASPKCHTVVTNSVGNNVSNHINSNNLKTL